MAATPNTPSTTAPTVHFLDFVITSGFTNRPRPWFPQALVGLTFGDRFGAARPVRDLDGLIKVRDLGVNRCGATATAAMLDEYRRREQAEQAGNAVEDRSSPLGTGGY